MELSCGLQDVPRVCRADSKHGASREGHRAVRDASAGPHELHPSCSRAGSTQMTSIELEMRGMARDSLVVTTMQGVAEYAREHGRRALLHGRDWKDWRDLRD